MMKVYEVDLRCVGSISGGEDALITARNFAEAAAKAEKLRAKVEKGYTNRMEIAGIRSRGDLRT